MGRPKKIDTRIAEEEKRILQIFADLDANKLTTVKPLIARAAFLTIHLEDLEEQLNAEGWTEEYQNGKDQYGVKKSAAADVHISLTKNLTAITKQLLELVPPAQKGSKLNAMRNR